MVRVLICLALFVAVAIANNVPQYDLKDAPQLFEKFIRDYNRHYTDAEDRQRHYDAFVKNLRDINKSNAESISATFGINKFTDYTPEEWNRMNGFRPPLQHQNTEKNEE